jgi:hypothetical protein
MVLPLLALAWPAPLSAVLIVVATALVLISRDVRTLERRPVLAQ